MATIHIATTGNDTTGNGTVGNPYLTKQKAHDVASSGDTIQCAAGTYTGATTTFSKAITVQGATGYSGLPTTIFSGAEFVYLDIGGYTTTFNDIMVTGASYATTGYSSWLVFWTESIPSTLTCNRCVFKAFVVGDDTAGRTGLVAMSDNTPPRSINTVNFNYCLFLNPTTTGSMTWRSAVLIGNPGQQLNDQINITNCTLYISSATVPVSIIHLANAGTVTVKNNIFNNVGGTSIRWRSSLDLSNTVTSYNDYYTNITNLPTLGTGDVQVDPLFIDPAGENFNLRPTSTLIDAATIV